MVFSFKFGILVVLFDTKKCKIELPKNIAFGETTFVLVEKNFVNLELMYRMLELSENLSLFAPEFSKKIRKKSKPAVNVTMFQECRR